VTEMRKALIACALGLSLILLAGLDASATPVFVTSTTYGGHTYSLFGANGISWVDAENAAVADGGYLAVLTTQAENNYVYSQLIGHGFFTTGSSQDIEAWLGARPADGTFSTTSPTNWAWVTGEAWTAFDASNFAPGEPNGDSSGLAINRLGQATYNDEGGHVGGFIVEKATATPEGGTTALFLGCGLLALGALRRRSVLIRQSASL
jgi:hypothetical protein